MDKVSSLRSFTKRVKGGNSPLTRAGEDKGKREFITAGRERFIQNTEPAYRKFMIGTPTLGTVRIEWASARRSLIIPINWGAGEFIATHLPESVVAQGYTTQDAENIILDQFIKGDYENLLFIEDDNLPPSDALLKMEVHILKARSPIIAGLYFSKGSPSWPLVFRGRGNGCFLKFNIGDVIWVDGLPLGFTLIHRSILKYLWDNSPEYQLPGGTKVKKVFEFPRAAWYDPELDRYFTQMGTCVTSDTEVLTQAGFKPIPHITRADKVLGLNPDTGEAEYVEDCGLVEYEHDGPMVHFRNQRIDLMVNGQHRMWYARRKGWGGSAFFPFGLERADVLLESNNSIVFSSEVKIDGKDDGFFEIPHFVGEQGKGYDGIGKTRFPIIPFATLVGWYLSDGCVSISYGIPSGHKYCGYKVHIAKRNKEFQKRIQSVIAEIGFSSWTTRDRVSFSSKNLAHWFSQFGYSEEKFIPRELLCASRSVLHALLMALLSCDGSIWRDGDNPRYEYRTTSKRLADDVQELAMKLGYRAFITKRSVVGKPVSYIEDRMIVPKHDVYTVRMSNYCHIDGRKIALKIDHFQGTLYSLAMPKCHVYMARRNNKCIWTGNSDLKMCDRIIQENVLSKTGWSDLAKKKYPFLCDTSIFVRHIDQQGRIYPDHAERVIWPKKKS